MPFDPATLDPAAVQQALTTALTVGATAAVQETAKQAVKEAWTAVKTYFRKNGQVDLAPLEADPAPAAAQALAGQIAARPQTAADPQLWVLINNLAVAVQAQPEVARSVGVDIGKLTNVTARFAEVTAEAGATGVIIDEVEDSTLDFGSVTSKN